MINQFNIKHIISTDRTIRAKKQCQERFNIATGTHEIFSYDATFHFVAELVAITN
jgi:hypothetical protein